MHTPAVIGYLTMVRKEVTRLIRIWSQTLLPPVVTATLYFLIFGTFIGSQVEDVAGYSYMQFIVPGLIMMNLIMNAYMNTVSMFYFSKFGKTIEELLVSPMPNWAVIAGFVTGGVLRSFTVGVLVTIIALFFTSLTVHSFFVIIAAAFLTSLLFSLAGLVNGIYAKSFDAISIVPNFVLLPLTYLGGVFYSIDLLPPVFQTISLFNPVLYMVNALRYGFLGVSDVSVPLAFGVMTLFVIVLMVLVLYLFKKGAGVRH
jgi:ABC-2 type transport system permease protein